MPTIAMNNVIESHGANRPPIGSTIVLHCDGATFQANPSSCGGIGFTVWCDDKLYRAHHAQLVGDITNNVAELTAIISALRWCMIRGMLSPTIYSDSELAIGFCNGVNTPKQQNMKHLVDYIKHRCRWMSPKFYSVPRTDAKQAFTDFAANLGIFADVTYDTAQERKHLLEAYAEWKRR